MCGATKELHELSEEESWLLEVRENMKVELLCDAHYQRSVSRYEFYDKYCSDPFNVHKKRSALRLSLISIEMYNHDHSLVPGKKLCMHCNARVQKEMEERLLEQKEAGGVGGVGQGGGEGSGEEEEREGDEEEEGGQMGGEGENYPNSQVSDHPWSQEFKEQSGFDKVNDALRILEVSPLKKKLLENKTGMAVKLNRVQHSIRQHLNLEPNHSTTEDDAGFIEALCTRYRTAADRNEKYKILTSVPSQWSAWRISKTFACSYTIAREALKLRQLFGPGSCPGLKEGHRIPSDVKQKVTEFYTAQDISRELPGRKDCVTVRTGGLREVKQKRLLLLSLREAYAAFREEQPECSLGFSTFASLRPREVVLPGKIFQILRSHQKCICLFRFQRYAFSLCMKKRCFTTSKRLLRDKFLSHFCPTKMCCIDLGNARILRNT